jgi:two-component system response regulator AtoC
VNTRLLIIEDDRQLSQMLAWHFEDKGYDVRQAPDCTRGLAQLRSAAVDLVLLDQQLPDGTGIDLLRQILEDDPEQAVVMMTGRHDLELAIRAIKKGAAEFIHKPIKTEQLEHVIARILEARRLAREVSALQPSDLELPASRALVGSSDAMLEVSKEIALCADSDAIVLITGESGTGKEVVARLIHDHSSRTGPFVTVNCAAIVGTLLESELFGHEKGAFTGAAARKPGKFELARDGTLFLDEIGELALPLQAKLLRALQEQVIERVGGVQQVATNTRVIAATNRDLKHEVAQGRFREDLAFRLNVFHIHLPPLRARKQDIPLLAEALIQKVSRNLHKHPLRLTEPALRALQGYEWPGNVRELENVLTQAILHARSGVLTPDLLPDGMSQDLAGRNQNDSGDSPLRSLDQVEAEHIQLVLDHTGGHKGKSCEILGISRPALDRKIKKYGSKLPPK